MAVGECAKFRSTGRRTIEYIQGGLWMAQRTMAKPLGCAIEDAPLEDIEMVMKVQKETMSGRDGKTYVNPVVHVAYPGTPEQLRKVAHDGQRVLKTNQQELLKLDARRFQMLLKDETAEEAKEISETFHPEAADDDTTKAKVIDGKAKVKPKVEPDAKAEPAADRIDQAAKEARAQMPEGLRRALESEDEPEDPDPARGDVDLPSRPAGEKKPKEKKDEWL